MANEITFGFTSGRTLTYAVYNPDGTEVTAPATALPEIGATGYYTATDGDITALDFVIVTDSVFGIIGQGQYQPDVTSSGVIADLAALEAKIDIIDAVVDSIQVNSGTVSNTFNEIQPPTAQVFND